MSYRIICKSVVDNVQLLEEAEHDQVPALGYRQMSRGESTYDYAFASWDRNVDLAFPPDVADDGSTVTYWYVDKEELCAGTEQGVAYTLVLDGANGPEFTDHVAIATVDGEAAPSGPVSTADATRRIEAKLELDGLLMARWVPLCGSPHLSGRAYSARRGSRSAAAAVYLQRPEAPPDVDVNEVNNLLDELTRDDGLLSRLPDAHEKVLLDDLGDLFDHGVPSKDLAADYLTVLVPMLNAPSRDDIDRALSRARPMLKHWQIIVALLEKL